MDAFSRRLVKCFLLVHGGKGAEKRWASSEKDKPVRRGSSKDGEYFKMKDKMHKLLHRSLKSVKDDVPMSKVT